MKDKKKEPIAWITKGGKHIPIFEDDHITSDEKKKEQQIEANKQQADEKNNTSAEVGSYSEELTKEERMAIRKVTGVLGNLPHRQTQCSGS